VDLSPFGAGTAGRSGFGGADVAGSASALGVAGVSTLGGGAGVLGLDGGAGIGGTRAAAGGNVGSRVLDCGAAVRVCGAAPVAAGGAGESGPAVAALSASEPLDSADSACDLAEFTAAVVNEAASETSLDAPPAAPLRPRAEACAAATVSDASLRVALASCSVTGGSCWDGAAARVEVRPALNWRMPYSDTSS
jgi:hypothetical protein